MRTDDANAFLGWKRMIVIKFDNLLVGDVARFSQLSLVRSKMSGAPMDSIILEEEIDPDYEPTKDEVEEYAKWIGMDLEADQVEELSTNFETFRYFGTTRATP